MGDPNSRLIVLPPSVQELASLGFPVASARDQLVSEAFQIASEERPWQLMKIPDS